MLIQAAYRGHRARLSVKPLVHLAQLSKFQTLAQAGSEDEEDDDVVDEQSFLTMKFQCLRDDLTDTVYNVPESITAGQAMMIIDNLIPGWKCKLIVNGKVWAGDQALLPFVQNKEVLTTVSVSAADTHHTQEVPQGDLQVCQQTVLQQLQHAASSSRTPPGEYTIQMNRKMLGELPKNVQSVIKDPLDKLCANDVQMLEKYAHERKVYQQFLLQVRVEFDGAGVLLHSYEYKRHEFAQRMYDASLYHDRGSVTFFEKNAKIIGLPHAAECEMMLAVSKKAQAKKTTTEKGDNFAMKQLGTAGYIRINIQETDYKDNTKSWEQDFKRAIHTGIDYQEFKLWEKKKPKREQGSRWLRNNIRKHLFAQEECANIHRMLEQGEVFKNVYLQENYDKSVAMKHQAIIDRLDFIIQVREVKNRKPIESMARSYQDTVWGMGDLVANILARYSLLEGEGYTLFNTKLDELYLGIRPESLCGIFKDGFGCEGCGELYKCRQNHSRDGQLWYMEKDKQMPNGQHAGPDDRVVAGFHKLCGCDCARDYCPYNKGSCLCDLKPMHDDYQRVQMRLFYFWARLMTGMEPNDRKNVLSLTRQAPKGFSQFYYPIGMTEAINGNPETINKAILTIGNKLLPQTFQEFQEKTHTTHSVLCHECFTRYFPTSGDMPTLDLKPFEGHNVSENRKAFKIWRSPYVLHRGVQQYKTAKKQTAATGGGVVDATDVAKKCTSLVANTGGEMCEICKKIMTELNDDAKRFCRTLLLFYQLSEHENFTVYDLQDSGGQLKKMVPQTLVGYLKKESDIAKKTTKLNLLNGVIDRCADHGMPRTWEAWKKERKNKGMCCLACWNKQCADICAHQIDD